MEANRYQILASPFIGLNGKLSQIIVKCHNVETDGEESGTFRYGYKHKNSNKVFYAVRKKPRVLERNPYTQQEMKGREDFIHAQQIAKSIINSSGIPNSVKKKAYVEFIKVGIAKGYSRLYNYVLARVRANGGVIPPEWNGVVM